MEEFKSLLLGEMSVPSWIFSFLLISVGAFMYAYLRVKKRKDQEASVSVRTWVKGDQWRNMKAVLFTICLSYVLIRFYANYQDGIKGALPEWLSLTPQFLMLIVGFGFQRISEFLAKWVNKE